MCAERACVRVCVCECVHVCARVCVYANSPRYVEVEELYKCCFY